MAGTRALGTHVAICDWHGYIKWISGDGTLPQKGDLLWKYVAPEHLEELKHAFGRVVALQEKAFVEVDSVKSRFSRLWMWPLESPEMAVCILGFLIPNELKLLSGRERDSLDLLAQGRSAKQIADDLDISLSSVHTHWRRAREKLGLSSIEQLIGFASRYCQPGWNCGTAPPTGTESDMPDLSVYQQRRR